MDVERIGEGKILILVEYCIAEYSVICIITVPECWRRWLEMKLTCNFAADISTYELEWSLVNILIRYDSRALAGQRIRAVARAN